MRLSEAIRLGSVLNPQGYLRLKDDDGNTCAMGAACEAIGIDLIAIFKLPNDKGSLVLIAKYEEMGWRELVYREVRCPVCDWIGGNLPITHLNDAHRWTRERIADWVQSIEDAQEEASLRRMAEAEKETA